jgi:hypothetical protein
MQNFTCNEFGTAESQLRNVPVAIVATELAHAIYAELSPNPTPGKTEQHGASSPLRRGQSTRMITDGTDCFRALRYLRQQDIVRYSLIVVIRSSFQFLRHGQAELQPSVRRQLVQ